ncbi:hypothetical protein VKT23_014547 [Stygiomarasmius scandens]|uniref:F-box domain-containing protein n=1 Tax=Marasmiellus scandens TaxID=2682957 RepID=A0ABR1J4V4_9AGAR
MREMVENTAANGQVDQASDYLNLWRVLYVPDIYKLRYFSAFTSAKIAMHMQISLNDRIPNEILTEILVFSCYTNSSLCSIDLPPQRYRDQDTGWEGKFSPPPQWILAHVCGLWRELVINMPILWTSISLFVDNLEGRYRENESYVLETLQGLLSRSDPADLPLTIMYKKSAVCGQAYDVLWGHSLFEALMERCGRWRSVTIAIGVLDCLPASLEFKRDRFVSLEVLTVFVSQECMLEFSPDEEEAAEDVVDEILWCLGRLPALQNFTLSHASAFLTSEEWCHNWKTVTAFECEDRALSRRPGTYWDGQRTCSLLTCALTTGSPVVIRNRYKALLSTKKSLVFGFGIRSGSRSWITLLCLLCPPWISSARYRIEVCHSSRRTLSSLDDPPTVLPVIGGPIVLQTLHTLHYDLEGAHSAVFFDYIQLPSLRHLRLLRCQSPHLIKRVFNMLIRSACPIETLHIEFFGLLDVTLVSFLEQTPDLKELSLHGPVSDYLLERLASFDASAPNGRVLVPKLQRLWVGWQPIFAIDAFINMLRSRYRTGLHNVHLKVFNMFPDSVVEKLRAFSNEGDFTVHMVHESHSIPEKPISILMNEGREAFLTMECILDKPVMSGPDVDDIAEAVMHTLTRSPQFRIPAQFGYDSNDEVGISALNFFYGLTISGFGYG